MKQTFESNLFFKVEGLFSELDTFFIENMESLGEDAVEIYKLKLQPQIDTLLEDISIEITKLKNE